jgi:hypothetical protein
MTSIIDFPESTDELKEYLYTLSLTAHAPKLVFEKIESYSLALSYRRNAYTQANSKAIALVAEWCIENSCGINDTLQELIIFRNEREMVWFMLRWS